MSIFREKKLLNQELDCDKEWVEFLSERVGKLLYKEKRIPTWKAIQLTQQEVVKYHQTCYQEKNMRIVDDRKNNIIIQRPSEIKTLTIPN
ncbi:MAG: hypothetical protein LBH96_04300 [Candidatus Peribacteria bacterium]|jgi:Fe-S oxidoreductase|nr:hypothetical protein [Candidatus Peribacteria bacterium]